MSRVVELVIKVGGSLLRQGGLAGRLHPIRELHERELALLVVPGGGPFADIVRRVYDEQRLSDSTAHWMAIQAMDQYALLLADMLADSVVVREPSEIPGALGDRQLPVLAPYEWIRRADPLPHTWAVSGDSIAAWIAGELGARKLILLKARSDRTGVDDYFPKVVPPGLEWEALTLGRAATGRRT